MDQIEVKVIRQPSDVAALTGLACAITQKPINSMDELVHVFDQYRYKRPTKTIDFCNKADHGSVTRHGVYTIAIVGASRRFLAQIRTHHVGIDFTSGSLQYQDVRDTNRFVVPYAVLKQCRDYDSGFPLENYLKMCQDAADNYATMIDDNYDNDTAGYVSCQALRNVILMTGNAEAFRNLIEKRACNRNTIETQYVAMKIWYALLNTDDGPIMFGSPILPCTKGACNQGKMCCGKTFPTMPFPFDLFDYIQAKWPLLSEV